jgi:hypothetical protein
MRSVALVARNGRRAGVVIWVALTIGFLPIASSATETPLPPQATPSAEPTLQPSTLEINGEALRIGVIPQWLRFEDGPTVIFAPANGRALLFGESHVLYGIEIGVKRTVRRDISGAFEDVIQGLKTTNAEFRSASITRLVKLAGHLGIRGTFSNNSRVTGHPEFVIVAAAPIEGGGTMYVMGVAPHEQFGTFRPTFEAMLLSLERVR